MIRKVYTEGALAPGGVGYRVEEYGESGVTDARAILRFEVEELGNTGMIAEAATALGCRATLEAVLDAVAARFGADARGIWLATERGVRRYEYAPDGTHLGIPRRVAIPATAVKLVDLGEADGAFFVSRGGR